jgi:hypothetical protein
MPPPESCSSWAPWSGTSDPRCCARPPSGGRARRRRLLLAGQGDQSPWAPVAFAGLGAECWAAGHVLHRARRGWWASPLAARVLRTPAAPSATSRRTQVDPPSQLRAQNSTYEGLDSRRRQELLLFPLGDAANGRGQKGAVMALKQIRTERPRTVGHVSHDAQVRVDQRVTQIVARQEAALRQARRAPDGRGRGGLRRG